MDSVFDNLATPFSLRELVFQREQQQNNIDPKIITLILPQMTVITKLMRTTYIPRHLNLFCCFSNWPLVDSHLDKLFDSDTRKPEDELDRDNSSALISLILVSKDASLTVDFSSSPVDELSPYVEAE